MKTRSDLAKTVPPGGVIIELGVAAGDFAVAMLTANPDVRYLGIDKWDDHHDEAEMERAIERLKAFRHAATSRSTFEVALPLIPDGWADLIYIDGYAHTGQEGGQTLRDWWPKLKPGGIFAGHDYSGHYPQTIATVDAFVSEAGLALNIIDENPHPSWWVKKAVDAAPDL